MSNDSNYYNLIKSMGFYPDAIAKIENLCDNALQDAGCTFEQINKMYVTVSNDFKKGMLDYLDISNSLMTVYLEYTKKMLEKKFSRAEVTYYVNYSNCSDAHLYVNGEEYFVGSSLIYDFRRIKSGREEIEMSNDSYYHNIMRRLGFYPDAIAMIGNLCDNALQDAGCTSSEINKMYESASRKFRKGNLDYSDISNSLIIEFLEYTKEMLEKKLSKADVDYYANCEDSHLYVNEEEYFEGSSLITDLLEEISRSIDAPER